MQHKYYTIEELLEILNKRAVYDNNTMVTYSQGRLDFVLCPINNKELFADLYVITGKRQNAKWKRIRTIQNMLIRARIHHTILLRICILSNSKGVQFIEDGYDVIIHIGKDFQNEQEIMQILDEYSLWPEE